MNELENFTEHWLSLEETLKEPVFFEDTIIPNWKRNNEPFNATKWFYQEDTLYAFKSRMRRITYLHELLGEKLTISMGLETVHYELAKRKVVKNGKIMEIYGLLSPFARKKGIIYKELQPFLLQKCQWNSSNLDILRVIDSLFDKEPIQKEFRLFLAREYLANELDRVSDEILIAKAKDGIHLGYLADFEIEFVSRLSPYYTTPSMLYLNLQKEEVVHQIKQDVLLKEAFQKGLEISLQNLLEELEQEKKLRLYSYEKEEILNFEQQRKEEIRKYLFR